MEVQRWKARNKVKGDKAALIDSLLAELAKPQTEARSRDDLQVETAVRLTFQELEAARTVSLEDERKKSALKRTLAASALMLTTWAGFTVNGMQNEQQEQFEKDRQEQIDKLPPEENGIPDEPTKGYDEIFE